MSLIFKKIRILEVSLVVKQKEPNLNLTLLYIISIFDKYYFPKRPPNNPPRPPFPLVA